MCQQLENMFKSRSMRFSNEPPQLPTQQTQIIPETQELNDSWSTCHFGQIQDFFDQLSQGQILVGKDHLKEQYDVEQKINNTNILQSDNLQFSFGDYRKEQTQLEEISHHEQDLKLEALQNENAEKKLISQENNNELSKSNQTLTLSDEIESVEAEEITNYLSTKEKNPNLEKLLLKISKIVQSNNFPIVYSPNVQNSQQCLLKTNSSVSQGKSRRLQNQAAVEQTKIIQKINTKQKKLNEQPIILPKADLPINLVNFVNQEERESLHEISISTNLSLYQTDEEYQKRLSANAIFTNIKRGSLRSRIPPVQYWLGERVSCKKNQTLIIKKLKRIEDYFSEEERNSLASYATCVTGESYISGNITLKSTHSISLALGGATLTIMLKKSATVKQTATEVLLKKYKSGKRKKRLSLHERDVIVLRNDCGADCYMDLTIII